VGERTYTEGEAKALAVEAATLALRQFAIEHPLPSCVNATEAAKMLNVSPRTLWRLNLPRNKAGKIPTEAVLEARRKLT
jgi:hypothetical protein